MNMLFRKNIKLFSIVSCLVLSSCVEVTGFKAVTAGIAASAGGVFSSPNVNLKEKNYAAADFLAGKVGHRISAFDVIRAEPLQEADHPGITSPLGRFIPEGVGLRLTDLGYRVQLDKVSSSEVALYPSAKSDTKYVLSGIYTVQKKHVDVILQIVDARTGVSVGRFEYDLLSSSEVRQMAETEPRIMKVEQ